jgi:hypothetical protein
MADKDELGLEHIAEELGNVADALSVEKKYYDEGLGQMIQTSLSSLIEKIPDGYYDKTLGETIKGALTEAVVNISKLGRPIIDTAPLAKMFSGIMEQNNGILNAILNIPKPETSKELIELIKKNNDFMQRHYEFMQKMIPKEIKPEAKIKEWEMTSVKDADGVLKTTAKAKI